MCDICDEENKAPASAIERQLNVILTDASRGLQETHALYTQGKFKPKHIEWVIKTRDALASTLADYEDGGGYTTVSDQYRNYATGALRSLEEDATALHAAMLAAGQPKQKQKAA